MSAKTLPTADSVTHHVLDMAAFCGWLRARIRQEIVGRIERLRAHGLFDGPAAPVQLARFAGAP